MIEETVVTALDPSYRQLCEVVEGMLGELPIGSCIKLLADAFLVVVPTNGFTKLYKSETNIGFRSKTLVQAHEDAMRFTVHIQDLERATAGANSDEVTAV